MRDLVLSDEDEEFRLILRQKWSKFRGSGWAFAVTLAALKQEVGYKKLSAWCRNDCRMSASAVSRLVSVGEFFAELKREDQLKWKQLPVWNVVEVVKVAKDNPDEAWEIASMAATQKQLRDKVSEARHEPVESEWRTFPELKYPASLSDLVKRATARARFDLEMVDPSPARIFEAWLAEYVDRPLLSEKQEEWRAAIEDGEGVCVLFGTKWSTDICGGYNATLLDPHHILPRSLGGGDGPVVLICRPCHEWHGEGNRWKNLARHLGFGDLVERVG